MDAIKEAVLYEDNSSSMFDLKAIRNANREMIVSENLRMALEISAGMRFLALARFHDAEIISIQKDTIYGKDAVEMIIDFNFAETNVFKKGIRKCKLQFIHAESNFDFEQAFDYRVKYIILACGVKLVDTKYNVSFEIYVSTPDDGYEDLLEIDFDKVNVCSIDKRKEFFSSYLTRAIHH